MTGRAVHPPEKHNLVQDSAVRTTVFALLVSSLQLFQSWLSFQKRELRARKR